MDAKEGEPKQERQACMEMSRVRIGYRPPRVVILFSASAVLGVFFLIWLNLSSTLSREEAEQRVRTLLSREITQKYMSVVTRNQGTQPDADSTRQLGKELRRIRELQFVTVDVRRLVPDYLLRPHSPTHVVRVVLRDKGRQYPARYFWISWGGVDRETSKYAWYFAL